MAVTSLSANSLKEIMFNLQMQLKHKGISGGKKLLKSFLEADIDKNGYLNRSEFESLLNKSGIFLSRMDVTYLMRHFDRNQDGKISFLEFYSVLVPELNARRANMISQIWQVLSDSQQHLSVSQIFSNLRAANHPAVASGHKSEEEILNRFLDIFDTRQKGPDGLVSEADFVKANREMSASYPIDDDSFIRMLECVWGVRENRECGSEEISSTEVLIMEKIRLRMKTTETEEQALLKVFKFVDLDGNGYVRPNEFVEALKRIGVNLNDEQVRAFLQKYDLDGTGALDYARVCKAIGGNNSHLFTKSTSHAFYNS